MKVTSKKPGRLQLEIAAIGISGVLMFVTAQPGLADSSDEFPGQRQGGGTHMIFVP